MGKLGFSTEQSVTVGTRGNWGLTWDFLTWWSYKTWAGPGGLSLGGLGAGTECDCNKGEICRDQNCNVAEGSITSCKTNLSLLKTISCKINLSLRKTKALDKDKRTTLSDKLTRFEATEEGVLATISSRDKH